MSRYMTTERPYLSMTAIFFLICLVDFIAGNV